MQAELAEGSPGHTAMLAPFRDPRTATTQCQNDARLRIDLEAFGWLDTKVLQDIALAPGLVEFGAWSLVAVGAM